MQLAFFLDLPLAILLVTHTPNDDYVEFYAAARAGRFLFHMWMPDDSLVDGAGRLPVAMQLPPANALEQARRRRRRQYSRRNLIR